MEPVSRILVIILTEFSITEALAANCYRSKQNKMLLIERYLFIAGCPVRERGNKQRTAFRWNASEGTFGGRFHPRTSSALCPRDQ